MASTWHDEFRNRMADFDGQMALGSEGVSLSIKVRVSWVLSQRAFAERIRRD